MNPQSAERERRLLEVSNAAKDWINLPPGQFDSKVKDYVIRQYAPSPNTAANYVLVVHKCVYDMLHKQIMDQTLLVP